MKVTSSRANAGLTATRLTRPPGADTGRLPVSARTARGLRWLPQPGWLDASWAVFSSLNLGAILLFPGWETIPFHFIWISFTLLYGFRTWATKPTLLVLGMVMAGTGAGIGLDVARGTEQLAELTEVPLMAAMFVAMVWHARRKLAAESQTRQISEANARLLATQRQFLQDASHQLRTPITIALGHAELLAGEMSGAMAGPQDQREEDVAVILGELNRLRRIAERLLVIAAADDPQFLHAGPVALDAFIMDVLRRWRPTAARRWQLGRLDKAVIAADRERLGLAVDALLENAVRHTADGDVIKLSVAVEPSPEYLEGTVRITVSDGGGGIAAGLLPYVFDRFRTGDGDQPRGTGLGLALVRAVARAHGGDVRVSSQPGQGSAFDLLLPLVTGPRPAAGPDWADIHDDTLARKLAEMAEQNTGGSWAQAARDVLSGARRHRVRTALIGICAAGSLAALAVAGTESGAATAPVTPPAPSFSAPLLGGQPGQVVALSQYRGKPLIVNFFASWCEPCQQETPLLAGFYRTEHGKIALIGLDENDTLAHISPFTRSHGVTYPVGFDPGVAVGSQFGVNVIPSTYFLDARHRIVHVVYGALTQATLNKGIALATGG